MIAAGGRLGRPEVEAIHNEAISRFGGMPGLRDPGLLDSALAQPFQTFGGVDLYPTLAQKAARYAWGIARNHPFADGNKRTAAACMAAYLRINGVRFKPRHDELYDAMVGIAEGTWGFEELAAWVEGNVARLRGVLVGHAVDDATAKAVTWMLAESVAQRMREGGARARTIAVGVRDAGTFKTLFRQRRMPCATNITLELAQAAWSLLSEIWQFSEALPARGIAVRGENLVPAADSLQMSLFDPEPRRAGLEAVDAAVDDLRRRFGNNCVVWGPKAWCADTLVMDAKRDNTVHPVSFFHR